MNKLGKLEKVNLREIWANEEYEKCKKIRKEHQEKFESFMEFLKEKYGQDLDAVSNYYSLR